MKWEQYRIFISENWKKFALSSLSRTLNFKFCCQSFSDMRVIRHGLLCELFSPLNQKIGYRTRYWTFQSMQKFDQIASVNMLACSCLINHRCEWTLRLKCCISCDYDSSTPDKYELHPVITTRQKICGTVNVFSCVCLQFWSQGRSLYVPSHPLCRTSALVPQTRWNLLLLQSPFLPPRGMFKFVHYQARTVVK